MVRPERFELPTFWFVARGSLQSHTQAGNYSQENIGFPVLRVGWFRLVLYPVPAQKAHTHLPAIGLSLSSPGFTAAFSDSAPLKLAVSCAPSQGRCNPSRDYSGAESCLRSSSSLCCCLVLQGVDLRHGSSSARNCSQIRSRPAGGLRTFFPYSSVSVPGGDKSYAGETTRFSYKV